jgi:endonuclease YncB( thermonuclease family)
MSSPEPSWTTKAEVLRVIDGDTIEVSIHRVIRVRMLDCWAPESRNDPRLPESDRKAEKQRGLDSKENLRQLCQGKTVVIQIPSDLEVAQLITMGRWLGHVWIEGQSKSLSEQQVESGFATKQKPEKLQ